MKKIAAGVAIFVIAVNLLCGCGKVLLTEEMTDTETESNVVTFTDDLGREIAIENPQRVAALLGSYADIWYLAWYCTEDLLI